MNAYLTGGTIKNLREQKKLTQEELAALLDVSGKAVSKWETGRGLPDISLLEPLSQALGVSVAELLSGEQIINQNRAGNLLRSHFYLCPICGNVIHAVGNTLVSCCGLTLPALEAEPADPAHAIRLDPVEDEYFVAVDHPMEKNHSLSFLAWTTTDRVELRKLYPEGNPEVRFALRGGGVLYACCNRHGLFALRLPRRP